MFAKTDHFHTEFHVVPLTLNLQLSENSHCCLHGQILQCVHLSYLWFILVLYNPDCLVMAKISKEVAHIQLVYTASVGLILWFFKSNFQWLIFPLQQRLWLLGSWSKTSLKFWYMLNICNHWIIESLNFCF